jgi:hypothetical protein
VGRSCPDAKDVAASRTASRADWNFIKGPPAVNTESVYAATASE